MKKNILNIILILVMVITVIFHFLVTQTDYVQKAFGINLNQKQVVIAKEMIAEGEEITPDKIVSIYMDVKYIIKNAYTEREQIENIVIASQAIYPGEQIVEGKVRSKFNAYNPKKLMYGISVDNLSTMGNFLYAGDKVSLWKSYNGGMTEKVFEEQIEIIALKNRRGDTINYDKTKPTDIPNTVIIRVDENDIKVLEETLSKSGNKFFFVKEII